MSTHTPLYDAHLHLGASMVSFHGWEMPVHYGSALQEHHAVRTKAGIFDVSHMTIIDILGTGGRQFLRRLLVSDIDRLTHKGKALYTCMCHENGGIIDDLIVYQRHADSYRLILNAATREGDLAWIYEKSKDFAIGIQERSDLAIIAVQGPESLQYLSAFIPPAEADAIATITPFESVEIASHFYARTGYTGEDGYEIILPAQEAAAFWHNAVAQGMQPCGLAARDTLRLEAGLLLNGQDMDATTTPLDIGLARLVHWEPEDRHFIGMGALLSRQKEGSTHRLVGLVLEDKGIMRAQQVIYIHDAPRGIITSGGFSPTANCSIALAKIPVSCNDTHVFVDIRGSKRKAAVVKPHFVKKGQITIENYQGAPYAL